MIDTNKGSFFSVHPVMAGVLVAAVIVLIILAMIEFTLQLNSESNPARNSKYIKWRLHEPNISRVVSPDKEYLSKVDGVVLKSARYRTDDMGFIVSTQYHKEPELNIIFLGGSTTECIYVEESKRFPSLVGEQLTKDFNVKSNSFNGGRSGNASVHSINNMWNVAMKKNPDYVVWMHNINDLVTLIHTNSYWSDNSSRNLIADYGGYDVFKHIKNKTFPRLYDLISPGIKRVKRAISTNQPDEFAGVRNVQFKGNFDDMKRQFESNLKIFISMAKQHGVTPIIMTQPNRFVANPNDMVLADLTKISSKGISYEQWKYYYSEFNQSIRDVSEKAQVLLIDLDSHVPKNNSYMYDAVHLTDKGSELVADIVTKIIAESLTVRENIAESNAMLR